jgi:polyhydroxybutyrate depolymerase
VVLDVDGLERSYVLTVPAASPDRPAALVIDLHGLGSDPSGQEEASGWAEKAADVGFVVAQPAARGAIPTWNPQPGSPGSALDIDFVRALVADVATKVALDPGRIYASGFSNGGGMAHRLACEAADLVAAIGTVAGQYVVNEDCVLSRPVAVIAFHGTDDVVVPYPGVGELLPDLPTWAQAWAHRNACGPVPERETVAADVLRDRWFGCDGDVEVALYTIDEGPHAWPGSDRPGLFRPTQSIDATDLMWEFFTAHARS